MDTTQIRTRRHPTTAAGAFVALLLALIATLTIGPGRSSASAEPPAAGAGGGSGPLAVGSRLTWQAGDSVLEGVLMVPDPEGIFERDGQRFSPRQSGGSGGVGLEQVTVVATGPQGVVGDLRTFLTVDLQANAQVAASSGVVLGTADRLDPYWVNPAMLASLVEGRDGGTTIVRGQRTFGGQPRSVVSISNQSPNSFASKTYDLATGVLLFEGTMVAAAGTTITDNGTTALQANGTVNYSHRMFAGLRVLDIPWAATALPDWVKPGDSVTFAGGTSMESDPSTGLGGFPGQQLAISYSFERLAAPSTMLGQQAVQSSTTAGVAPLSQATPRVFTSVGFDGLWLPPGVLRTLRPQQVLDQDPMTGQTTTFAGTQQNAAVILVTSGLEQLELYYDTTTGRLLMARNRQQVGGSATSGIGAQIVELRWTGA